MSDKQTSNPKPLSRRKLAAGMVGNVIEWYDFGLYGFMAVIISNLFFPHEDKLVSLIGTYGIFAVGFLMRPLGAVVLGHLGDTIGRKPVLILSVVLMVVPTIAIGLLPTYADWGIAATLALVAVRLVQGFSVGGEFSSSVTYLIETAPPGRRGQAGSWANVGSVGGLLLGAGTPATVIWILGDTAINDWGWRLPFLFGGVIGIIALALRRGLPEDEAPPPKRKKGDHPIKRVMREEPGALLKVMLFCASYGVIFYIPVVYLPTWLSLYTTIELHEALYIVTLAQAVQIPLAPLVGRLTDRVVPRTHFLAMVFAAMAIAAIPLFLLAGQGLIWLNVVIIVFFCALIAGPLGAAPATLSEAFDRGHRLTGYSLSFNMGIGIAGGTAPMIATALISLSGWNLSPAVYLAAFAALGSIAMLSLRDRSREPLR